MRQPLHDPSGLDDHRTDFDRRYSEVLPALYSWAYLRVGAKLRRHLDPGDVVQEVGVRAYEAYGRFDPSLGAFRSWVFRIAKNYLNEVLRRAAVARRTTLDSTTGAGGLSQFPESATNLSTRVARDDALTALLEFVASADPVEAELFERCALQGEPCAKAAVRMGLTEDAAQKRWMRFREKLRGRPWVEELLGG